MCTDRPFPIREQGWQREARVRAHLRRTTTSTTAAISAIPATPPTTAPAMGPAMLFFFFFSSTGPDWPLPMSTTGADALAETPVTPYLHRGAGGLGAVWV